MWRTGRVDQEKQGMPDAGRAAVATVTPEHALGKHA